MTAEPSSRNPYPGPRPFERGEHNLFFGRDREVADLLSLMIAHREVLLYAQSGAGKTSLLNAGVMPSLIQEGFECRTRGPSARPHPRSDRSQSTSECLCLQYPVGMGSQRCGSALVDDYVDPRLPEGARAFDG